MNNQPNQNNAFAHLFKNAPQRPSPLPPPAASMNPPTEEGQKKPNSAETGGPEATTATKLSTSNELMAKDVPNMPLEQDRPAMPKPRAADFGIVPKKRKVKPAKKKAKKPAKKTKKKAVKKVLKKGKPKPKKKTLKKAAKKTVKKSAMKKGKKAAKKKAKKAPTKKKKGAKSKKHR